jgi:hypothetical protein
MASKAVRDIMGELPPPDKMKDEAEPDVEIEVDEPEDEGDDAAGESATEDFFNFGKAGKFDKAFKALKQAVSYCKKPVDEDESGDHDEEG